MSKFNSIESPILNSFLSLTFLFILLFFGSGFSFLDLFSKFLNLNEPVRILLYGNLFPRDFQPLISINSSTFNIFFVRAPFLKYLNSTTVLFSKVKNSNFDPFSFEIK